MARHNSKWTSGYSEFEENILFKNDKILFQFIEQIESRSKVNPRGHSRSILEVIQGQS